MYMVLKNIDDEIECKIAILEEVIKYQNHDSDIEVILIDNTNNSVLMYISNELFKVIQNSLDQTTIYYSDIVNDADTNDDEKILSLEVIADDDDDINSDLFIIDNNYKNANVYSMSKLGCIQLQKFMLSINLTSAVVLKTELENIYNGVKKEES